MWRVVDGSLLSKTVECIKDAYNNGIIEINSMKLMPESLKEFNCIVTSGRNKSILDWPLPTRTQWGDIPKWKKGPSSGEDSIHIDDNDYGDIHRCTQFNKQLKGKPNFEEV